VAFDPHFNNLHIGDRRVYTFGVKKITDVHRTEAYTGEFVNFIAFDNKTHLYCVNGSYPVVGMHWFYRGDLVEKGSIGYSPEINSFELNFKRDDRYKYILAHPSGIAVGNGNMLYIADDSDNKIIIFKIHTRSIFELKFRRIYSYIDFFNMKFKK